MGPLSWEGPDSAPARSLQGNPTHENLTKPGAFSAESENSEKPVTT